MSDPRACLFCHCGLLRSIGGKTSSHLTKSCNAEEAEIRNRAVCSPALRHQFPEVNAICLCYFIACFRQIFRYRTIILCIICVFEKLGRNFYVFHNWLNAMIATFII